MRPIIAKHLIRLPDLSPLRLGGRLLVGAAAVGALTLLLLIAEPSWQEATASQLFVLVVVLVAAALGLIPAILAAVMASVLFNYYFLAPARAFDITSIEDALRLLSFVAVAVLSGSVAGYARSQAEAANRRAAQLSALYQLSQTTSAELDIGRIAADVARTVPALLGVPGCRVLIADTDGELRERALSGEPPSLDPAEHIAVQLPAAGPPQLALQVARPPYDDNARSLLAMIAGLLLLAAERARHSEEAARARVLAESDRLKSTLLSSVSHDLRTPLAVIKGAVTNLLDEAVAWDAVARRELLGAIDEETDRLNRLVGDLLAMSRIEAGALEAARDWQDLGELVATVVARLAPRYPLHQIVADVAAGLPPVRASYVQLDHVLTNLVENAARYAPPGTAIEIRAALADADAGEWLAVEVLDRGPGVPAELRERIFEKFVRAEPPERSARGSGLGLAICKGLIEAHAGRIWVEARPGGGARFVFTLPVAGAEGRR